MWMSAVNKETLIVFSPSLASFLLLSFLMQAPVPVTEDMQRNQMTSTTSAPGSPQEAVEVRTENLFQRTEVLAGMCHNRLQENIRPPLLTYSICPIKLTPLCVSIFDISSVVPSSLSKTVICFHEAEHRYDDRRLKRLFLHFGIHAFYISCQLSVRQTWSYCLHLVSLA